MLQKLTQLTLRLLAGVNVGVILLLLVTGWSGLISPVHYRFSSLLGLSFPLPLLVNLFFLFFWLMVKKRYALIPVAGLLLGFVPIRTYFPINWPSTPPPRALKVLTYNVAGFGFYTGLDYRTKPNPVAKYLLESKADIICLQEAREHELAADSLLHTVYPYSSVQQRHSTAEELVVYSKFPIRKVELVPYEANSYATYAYYLEIEGREVMLLNVHLESNGLAADERNEIQKMVSHPTKADERREASSHIMGKIALAAVRRAPQVDAIVKYIRSRRGGRPIILMGDFNETPIAYSHRQIGNLLTDCYVSTGLGPGFSFNRNHIFVRIDNIFCSEDFQPYGCRVDPSISFSDHYPVYCYLTWK